VCVEIKQHIRCEKVGKPGITWDKVGNGGIKVGFDKLIPPSGIF